MARDTQINMRVSAEEHADITQAAEDAGMGVSEWARTVLCYAAGRPIAEHLDRAAEIGRKATHAALAKALKGKNSKSKAKTEQCHGTCEKCGADCLEQRPTAEEREKAFKRRQDREREDFGRHQ